MNFRHVGALIFLSVFLIACGGGASTNRTEDSTNNSGEPADTQKSHEPSPLAGFWDETTYNTQPPYFGYRFVSITESGEYTSYNFKLSDTGDIELCVFDKQGTLTYLSDDHYLDTVTYPAFERPGVRQLTVSNDQLTEAAYDRVMPPASPDIATLEDLMTACGSEPPVYDFSAVQGLWKLATPVVIYFDEQGFYSVFFPDSTPVSAYINSGRLIPLANNEMLVADLHWIQMQVLEDGPLLKVTDDGDLTITQIGYTTELSPYEEMDLDQLLAASANSNCSSQEWHLMQSAGLANVQIKSDRTPTSSTVCLATNGTQALISQPAVDDLNSSDPARIYVHIPDTELSCPGEHGYVEAQHIRIGANACMAAADSLRVSPTDGTAPVLMDSPSLNNGSKVCVAFGNTPITLAGTRVADDQLGGLEWQPVTLSAGHCANWLGTSTVAYVNPHYIND